ncbi:MAG TPA: SIMPL domain-containing protein [Candidatus Acidoferrales bacterium]|nr:SIMPL domain-containing protein [Candidatus Acidoferrales bacterium]
MWRRALLYSIVFWIPAFGQNSVTVTATRPANIQPDQVLLGVDVLTAMDATRDDVLSALQGSIVTAASLSGVRTVQQYVSNGAQSQAVQNLDWSFTLTAPLANFSSTLTQLTALQQAVAQKKNGMSVSFSVQGTQVSAQAQQSQTCSTADLLTDARAQAQKMAAAAGAGLGNVLAMSGATVSQPAGGALFSSPIAAPLCSMTVKFALTGF